MNPSAILPFLPPFLWVVIWFISLVNQFLVLGEVNTDIEALSQIGPDQISDWDDLMQVARSNRYRTRLKTSFAFLLFLGGVTVMAALIANVRFLYSIFNVLTSIEFFAAGLLFLRLSYHDRGTYRIAAASRIKRVAQQEGVE